MKIKDLLECELLAGKGEGGGGTTDYNALSNKPSIGGVTLMGNKTLADLGISTTDCEMIVNKVATIDGATATDTNYPSEKAVVNYVGEKISEIDIPDVTAFDEHIADSDIHVTAEEKARWNAGGGGGGGADNYNALNNKPSVNGVTLIGNKTLTELGFTTSDCEKLSNKVTEIVRKTASDTNYPSEKAVSDALTSLSTNLNNSILGFYNTLSEAIARSEEIANKVTAIDGASPTDTHYPSEKAVADALIALSSSLSSSFNSGLNGLSQSVNMRLSYKENSSNKVDTIETSGLHLDDDYPSVNAVKGYVEAKLGGKENSSNKSNSISGAGTSTNYPTTKAVVDYVESQLADIDTALDAIIGGDY